MGDIEPKAGGKNNSCSETTSSSSFFLRSPRNEDLSTHNELSNLQKTFLSLKYAAGRSTGILIEYPLECIKTRWQANPNFKSLSDITKHSYQNYGLRGFYHGFIPNAVRKIPTQMFRWPVILQSPHSFRELLNKFPLTTPEKKSSYYSQIALTNFMSAVTIASIETPISAPFDTCRLDFIVNPEKTRTLLDYFKLNSTLQLQFKGLGALYLKEIFGWTSFLVSCNVLRQGVKDYNGDNTIKPYQILPISLTVGVANAAAIMPWDVARSQIQKNKHSPKATVGNAIKSIIDQHGYKGLYVGWGIRALQISLATALSIPVMEKFENELQDKTAPNQSMSHSR
jgi:hypothetical protein